MKNTWGILVASAVFASALMTPGAAEAATYTVQKGDTLIKIAKAHNTTVQQLKQLNGLKNDNIFIQQKLSIKTAKVEATITSKAKQTKTVKQENNQKNTHKVVKNDTLSKVAKKYKTTVANIKLWNDLKSDNIYIGQTLKVAKNAILTKQDDGGTQFISEEVIPVEAMDAVVEFLPIDVIEADKFIAAQLASEELITQTPSSNGLTTYNKVLQTSRELLGIPYAYAGNTIEGFDCSGFVNYVYATSGINIQRKSSLDYFQQDTTKVQNPIPGDLVFFKNTYISNISHMGIYMGNGEFIHAGTRGIEISKLDYTYWKERFVAFKRLKEVY